MWIDEQVAVPGGAMRLRRAGNGIGPTVLFDAGWGHWSAIWGAVQARVAAQHRTVSFDRRGLGRSTPGPLPRTSFQIVDELEEALEVAAIDGPFVYVAHSFGAVHARVFAHRRSEVRGLVLVDPVVEALGLSPPFVKLRARLGENFRRLQGYARAHVLTPASYLLRQPAFARKLPRECAREFKRGYSAAVIDAVLAELAALEDSMDQLSRLGAPAVPFEIVSAGTDWLQGTADGESAVQSMHRKLAVHEQGAHRVVPGAGHDVHVDAPDDVAEAVEALLQRVG